MDTKKLRRKPKLERRNAIKYFDYDAGPSSSSFDDSSGSLYTRSMELYDRSSFRIEGVEGELDRICMRLGLSGPEDFAIPAAAWEAMKIRFSEDFLPNLKLEELDVQRKVNEVRNSVEDGELTEKFEDRDRVRVIDEVVDTVVAVGSGGDGGGINGIRPPMLKPPPGMRVPVVDNTCSTWDLLKELAPVREEEILNDERVVVEKEGEEVGRVSLKRKEEVVDNAEIVAEFSESCSFTTPNGINKRVITPRCWQKGGFLGGGSFGSVYEGISE